MLYEVITCNASHFAQVADKFQEGLVALTQVGHFSQPVIHLYIDIDVVVSISYNFV